MDVKDKFGTRIKVLQAVSGKIIIPVGNRVITLSREDAETFSLWEIDDFDMDLYKAAYNNNPPARSASGKGEI
jgi:hypothetical protein